MRLHTNLSLTLLIAFAFALPALAAAKDKTKGLPPASPANTEIDNKPVQDAKAKLGVAQGKVEHAQDAMNALLVQLRKDAETSPAIADAVTALKQAQADYDTATAPILLKVRSTPEYTSAMADKQAAAKNVLALQAEVPPNQAEITKAATIVLNKGHAITQLESAALAADPTVSALKEKLNAANSRLLKARYAAEQSIKTDPQVAVAKKTVEDAQAEVAPLQSAYNTALEKYNNAVAARNAANNNNGSNPNNHSTSDYNGGHKMYKKKP
jgi:hypothetical protein